MPHIIVKVYAGRSEEQKNRLAQEVSNAVMSSLNCEEKTISVGIEEFAPADWKEKVYRPDILEKSAMIYKKPGY